VLQTQTSTLQPTTPNQSSSNYLPGARPFHSPVPVVSDATRRELNAYREALLHFDYAENQVRFRSTLMWRGRTTVSSSPRKAGVSSRCGCRRVRGWVRVQRKRNVPFGWINSSSFVNAYFAEMVGNRIQWLGSVESMPRWWANAVAGQHEGRVATASGGPSVGVRHRVRR
jgi:hypothetical protein